MKTFNDKRSILEVLDAGGWLVNNGLSCAVYAAGGTLLGYASGQLVSQMHLADEVFFFEGVYFIPEKGPKGRSDETL